MSVLMTLRVTADAKAIESTDAATLQAFAERAKSFGVISHHFYGNGSEVLVVDEWPDEQSFHKFFQSSPDVSQMMERAGVTAAPTPEFWRRLDVNDSVG